MNAQIFAEWLRRQGHHVVRTESSYWYDAGPRVLQAFPYHWVVQPSAQEMRELTIRQNRVAARYSAPLGVPDGMVSYHAVLGGPYNPKTLNDAARSDIRRGLRHCQVEPISCERLAEEAWTLQHDTLERQGRAKSMSQSEWKRICLSAKDLPGFEAWGAIHDGELVSALLSCTLDDTVSILYQQSSTCHLPFRVNNALISVFTQAVLERPDVRYIFYGLHSLDAPPSVDEFKFRMGYSAKPVRQRVIFNPYFRPFVNHLSHGFIKACLKIRPDSATIAKAEGIFRFYLQGKRPLSGQHWPKALMRQKDAILTHHRETMEGPSSGWV
jgi:hypothetical protein